MEQQLDMNLVNEVVARFRQKCAGEFEALSVISMVKLTHSRNPHKNADEIEELVGKMFNAAGTGTAYKKYNLKARSYGASEDPAAGEGFTRRGGRRGNRGA